MNRPTRPLLFAASFAALTAANAANVTLTASDPLGTSSFDTAGGWSNLAAPSAGNAYFTGVFDLRSTTAGTPTFAGDSLSIDAGGFFSFKSAGTHTVGNLILNGGTIQQSGFGGTGTETATLGGAITVQANSVLQIGGGTGTNFRNIVITAPIGGPAGLTINKLGTLTSNTLTLNAAGSYAGTTTINGGTVIIRNSTSLGGTANGTIVNGADTTTGTVLQMNPLAGTLAVAEPLTLAASAAGRAYLDNGAANNAYNGDILLTGANVTGFRSAAGTMTINGNISGPTYSNSFQIRGAATGVINGDLNIPLASINKTDGSTWTIGDATPSTYAWTTMNVSVGTLIMGAAGVMPAGSSVIMGQADNQSPVWNLNGFNQTIGALSMAGGSTGGNKRITNNGAAAAVLTVSNSNSSSFGDIVAGTTGTLNNGTGVLGLNKAGTGTLTLSGGAISYTGATTVSGGTLLLRNATAFASDIANNAALRLEATSAWTFARNSTGSGSLAKFGAATFTLQGNQAHTGATTVEQGTLSLSSATANNIASSSVITVNAGATLDATGLAGGALDVASGQTLKGAGTVSGGLIIDADAILSPGASPGKLSTGFQTWGDAGVFAFELDLVDTGNVSQNALAGLNDGHDTVDIAGALTIAASSASPFRISLVSLQLNDSPGPVANWNPNLDYTWTLATASGGVAGFDPAKFHVLIAGFAAQNTLNGSFSVSADATRVFLNYVAVPEPSGVLLLGAGLAALALGRRAGR